MVRTFQLAVQQEMLFMPIDLCLEISTICRRYEHVHRYLFHMIKLMDNM